VLVRVAPIEGEMGRGRSGQGLSVGAGKPIGGGKKENLEGEAEKKLHGTGVKSKKLSRITVKGRGKRRRRERGKELG